MKKETFPLIALVVSLLLLGILFRFSDEGNESRIPLLTMLLMSEFSFLITAGGSFVGAKALLETGLEIKQTLVTAGCMALSLISALQGYGLWRMVNSG